MFIHFFAQFHLAQILAALYLSDMQYFRNIVTSPCLQYLIHNVYIEFLCVIFFFDIFRFLHPRTKLPSLSF
jgi:hypothetical protein